MEADFSGWATKTGLKCSDGRTIMPEAFQHMDGKTVPLVWQHRHNEPENVMGHAVLEARDGGLYAYGFFNGTASGLQGKALVQHKDVNSLSIYANQLVERGKQVFHGVVRELSLVLSGANPGALIDHVAIAHGDGSYDVLDDEATIFTGLELEFELEHADSEGDSADGPTIKDVYDSFTEEQKNVVHFMIGAALEASDAETTDGTAAHADLGLDATVQDVFDALTDQQKDVVYLMIGSALEAAEASHSNTDEDSLSHQEGNDNMSRNVFEQNGITGSDTPHLSHDQITTILADARHPGATLKSAFLAHAGEYGITDINLLFPDAKTLSNTPEFISRRMEWVSKVLGGTRHAPFSKIKTILADITAEEARAKGYVKGNQKVEEVFGLLKRTTGPTTIYKKQKLDRDDIIDITDLDVVSFLKAEMRLMIEEELARAILVGDGRSALSPDKVKDPAGAVDGTGIRSILNDSDLYTIKATLAANVTPKEAVKGLVRARSKYRGSGKPELFISDDMLTDIMLEEDKFGRPLYATEQALADKLRVAGITTVDLFGEYDNLFAIMVSLSDYTIGSTRGGELTNFEDFDIDFNQEKYLQETRLSGALTKPYSAIVVYRGVGTLATATAPSFNGTTDTITIPTATGVNYLINDEVVTGDVVITGPTEVVAEPTSGYFLAPNTTRTWTYTV